MNKEKDYSDLHNKTIFDFIDSEDDLKLSHEFDIIELLGCEEYIDDCRLNPLNNALLLDELGYVKGDYKLRDEVQKQFKDELKKHFKE